MAKKSWSEQEKSYIKRYAKSKTLADLAGRFDAREDEVRAQLAALGVTTKDGQPASPSAGGPDPEIADYEAGIRAFGAGKLDAAEKAFRKVLDATDRPEVAARARQHLTAIDRRRGGEAGDADPYTRAVFERNRGDVAAALALAEKHAKGDADGRFALLAAGLHSASDRENEAVAALTRAVERDPVNRVRAYHDADLAELRKKKEHAHLFALES
jgi:tetratricopeptide (TPR) repeat protein